MRTTLRVEQVDLERRIVRLEHTKTLHLGLFRLSFQLRPRFVMP